MAFLEHQSSSIEDLMLLFNAEKITINKLIENIQKSNADTSNMILQDYLNKLDFDL